MNINWELVGWVLSIIFGVVGVVWVIVGIWFYRFFTKFEKRDAERRARLEEIRNRRRN
ncbi:membrane protein [Serratia phage vB_Sru_IME250]|uniref:Uncharacterized protein n=1 Tax=Serratia phage vB_Sru_IME250 TaxID=1852640 RepID=A0A1J0MGD7_9CAUD|nr:membrane protein [Serratia phage vB_Sru_IME250]ANM47266.1 hypothetical protein [Serratia phage vB_Sru_IME250]APD20174.1 hypothetical protein [Serratia phage vB_Sru_IME250]